MTIPFSVRGAKTATANVRGPAARCADNCKVKAVITGAGGFIGSHLAERLLADGHEVSALVRYNSAGTWGHLDQFKRRPSSGLHVRSGDIRDPFFVDNAVRDADVVFHLAALIAIPYSYEAPASYVQSNVVGTLNVLEACKSWKTKRLIITSTSEVYGTAQYTPIDERHPLQAQSPYAATKIAADKLAESYIKSYGLPAVVLRPFNTYGPRQSARALIPTILAQALSGADQIVLGNLTPMRDLTFVSDTVRAFVLAAETPDIEGETIHVGQGTAVSVRQIAECCLKIVGSRAKITSSEERQRPHGSEVELLVCNAEKARCVLKWQPEIPFDAGLAAVAEYVAQHLSLLMPGLYTV